MSNCIYEILVDKSKVAECYTLEDAVIITKALFVEYYNEPDLEITIKRRDGAANND